MDLCECVTDGEEVLESEFFVSHVYDNWAPLIGDEFCLELPKSLKVIESDEVCIGPKL